MILGNYNIFNANPGRELAGVTNAAAWMKGACLTQWLYGDSYIAGQTNKSSFYNGFLPPYNIGLPIKAGGLSTGFNLQSSGSASGTVYGGVNIATEITGTGTISNAEGSLLAGIVATLIGSGELSASALGGLFALCELTGTGTISSADLGDGITRVSIQADIAGVGSFEASALAGVNISADMSGSGSIESALTALASLVSEIIGTGSLSGGVTAKGWMTSTISTFTELSPESLAASVWNAVASEFNNTGSMGNKVNLASVGNIDYVALADAVWESLKITYDNPATLGGVLSVLQEKLTELHRLQGLESGVPMTVTQTRRTAGDIELILSGDGQNSKTVTRI